MSFCQIPLDCIKHIVLPWRTEQLKFERKINIFKQFVAELDISTEYFAQFIDDDEIMEYIEDLHDLASHHINEKTEIEIEHKFIEPILECLEYFSKLNENNYNASAFADPDPENYNYDYEYSIFIEKTQTITKIFNKVDEIDYPEYYKIIEVPPRKRKVN